MVTQKELHELFNYSSGKLFWKITKARRIKIGDEAGWFKRTGYAELCLNDVTYGVHRLIYLYHYGELPKYVDHIDRNPSNNKIENLRPISARDNRINSAKTWNESGYRGVKKTRNGKFEARINKNGVYFHLGTYNTPEEAHKTYQTASQQLYPEIYV